MRKSRGFTLVELMVVVTIIGVLASIAIATMTRGRTEGDSDAWANAVRNATIQARRRATATKNPYVIEISAKKMQWCQIDATACAADAIVSCAAPPAGAEVGRALQAGSDAMTDSVANSADISSLDGTYSPPPHASLGGTTKQIFFGPNGGVDSRFCSKVMSSVLGLPGVTVYVRAFSAVAHSSSATEKHRRIVMYGATGRPRIIDNW